MRLLPASIIRRLHLMTAAMAVLYLTGIGILAHFALGFDALIANHRNADEISRAAYELEINVAEYGIAVLAYLNNPGPAYLAAMADEQADFERALSAYRKISAAMPSAFAELVSLQETYTGAGAALVSLTDGARNLAGQAALDIGSELRVQHARLIEARTQLDRVLDDEIQVAAQSSRDLAEASLYKRVRTTLTVAAALILILALGGIAPVMFGQRLRQRFSQLMSGANLLAQGDLGQRVVVPGGDEITHIAATLNDMAGRLQESNLSYQEMDSLLTRLGRLRINVSESGTVLSVSVESLDILGYAEHELIGSPVSKILKTPPPLATLARLAQFDAFPALTTQWMKADGSSLPVRMTLTGLGSQHTETGTRRCLLIAKPVAAGEFAGEHFTPGEAIAIVDSAWTTIFADSAFAQITGHPPENIQGRSLMELLPALDLLAVVSYKGDLTHPLQFGHRTPGSGENQARTLSVRIEKLGAGRGNTPHYCVTLTDISHFTHRENKARQLALTDVLTGLPNRRSLTEQLHTLAARAKRNSSKFALLFLDLDGFKPVNDGFGHEAGDALLRETGTRLRQVARQSDLVARLGGDEFCIVARDLADDNNAARLAMKCLAAIAPSMTLNHTEISITGSIGIAIFPTDGHDAEALLHAEVVEDVRGALKEFAVDPSRLQIEITESVTQAREHTAPVLHALKALGVSLAIDDFGTGYSSLASLRDLPIDVLKIDRSFINEIPGNKEQAAVTAAIAGMSRALGIEAVAEGVETLDQVHWLTGLGCRYAQGYLFSEPVPSQDIPALMQRRFLLATVPSRIEQTA
ncbi:MAG: EAL domain-containing protein [Burkholderiales bacterium]